MDETKWHHVAEQRCKRDGCKYMTCLRTKPQSECMPLRRAFEQCKTHEMEQIKLNYEQIGVQANIDQIRKPDKLRDMYRTGKSIYKD
jgi:hypothetical protein